MPDTSQAIRLIADISTAHLSEADAQRLTAGDTPTGLRVMDDEYGFLVAVPPAGDEAHLSRLPTTLHQCLSWAREQDAAFVLFDRDADPVEGLPTYDW